MIKKLLLPLFLILFVFCAEAQIGYKFTYSTGTYTALTGATNVALTALSTGTGVASPAYDDGYKNGITIPFTFTFNGTPYTKLNVCSNGFVSFSTKNFATTTSTTAPVYLSNHDLTGTNSVDTAFRPIIAPFWADLDVQSASTGITYKTLGASPNRIFTMQWKNAKWDYGASAGSISFQMLLHEGTNVIDFIYQREAGEVFSSGTTPSEAAIGITTKSKGILSFISVQDTSATPVASKTSEVGLTGRPLTGQIYTFTPTTITNDAIVTAVYPMSNVATAGTGSSQPIGAIISNGGTAPLVNLNVSLNITGANSYTDSKTITSLPGGNSVYLSFTGFLPVNAGTNNIAVTIPNDDDNTNNSATVAQVAAPSVLDYTSSGPTYGGFGQTTTLVNMAAKFANSLTIPINSVLLNFTKVKPFRVEIRDTVGGNGAPKNLLWSSNDTVSSIGSMIVPVNPPLTVSSDFFVVVNQLEDTAALGYSYEYESPLRLNTFYLKTPNTGGWLDIANTNLAFIKLSMGVLFDIITPVKLIEFKGKNNGKYNLLSWTTTNEVNAKGFEIERSTDGKQFEKIGFVSANNLTSENAYSYNDAKLGSVYYRLKIMDKDGKFVYSNVVFLKDAKSAAIEIVSVYPNPTSQNLNMVITTASAKKAIVVITDVLGKIVAQQNIETVAGENTTTINVSKIASGTYYVKLICEDGCETIQSKFIKK